MVRFKEFVTEKVAAAETTKFKGVLNWHGEILNLYCHASSEAQAKNLVLGQLAKKLGVVPAKVKMYYNQNPNGIKVSKAA